MVILITGDTHTGKTLLAKSLLEKYKYPYLSIDHLKMGLIRSGQSNLSADSNGTDLTNYLWPIIREIIKTNIENAQNIIVEGCYVPFGWEKDFSTGYLQEIKYICLIFSRKYIENHFCDMLRFENLIENRLSTDLIAEELIKTNEYNLEQCVLRNYNHILIDNNYPIDLDSITVSGWLPG